MNQKTLDIYNDLIKKYHNLSIEEQRAILIYKSQLYHFMNAITSVDNFENLEAEEIASKIPHLEKYLDSIAKFKDVIDLPMNMTIKYTVFGSLKMDNYLELIDSLKEVYSILLQAREKITLEEDLVVYRGVSLDGNISFNQLSRGNIISTSIKLEDAENFLFTNSVNVLFVIKIPKGMHVLVSPISLVRTYQSEEDYLYHKLHGIEPTLFKLMERDIQGQQEVILFQEDFQIKEQKVDTKIIGEDKLLVVTIGIAPFPIRNNHDREVSRSK